ncbi:Toluene efflux pump membrane transporter TtgE [Planctomycetes bacterium Pla163]|uniref:Toluene efflux pump membrane transporter TtgE n=1 Tax=Rohdeia mirabilis TaxID=2528008 RepID=A0A518D3E3_9BACT|nr:Toluene efflux pump membrane transporter TtgE [Planctomycetes bacterium Pla163]
MKTPAQDVERGFDLFRLTVARPIGLGVIFLTLIVVGILAYVRIPLQLLPSGFAEPQLNVWVSHPGSNARENEEQVARPIEEELRTLAGLTRVRSWSREGQVQLRISFDPQLDPDLMKAEIRDRLERARPTLPDSIGDIGTWSEDADQMPISFFGILYEQESDRTTFLLDQVIMPRLEGVDGISRVEVFGALDDSIRILLDEDRVAATGTDVGALIRRLSSDNFATPLGTVSEGEREFILRSDMRFTSLEDIENYPIGRGLTIADVGRVIRAKSVRDRLSRIDHKFSYFAIASKEAGANVVDASRGLLAAMEELKADPQLEGQFSFMPFFVQGQLVENSMAQLRNTAVWGGALAVVVLLVFLRRLRLTLAVALCIPVSALLAIAWEYFTGGSFNMLTMVGITLAMGMLVDNAVVVVENISRHRQLGLPPLEAARVGAKEIALAVTLATMTTVVVFLPLIFMTENPMARVFLRGLGLPLSISLLFSLLVAVVFLPTLAGRILGDRPAWTAPITAVFGALGNATTRVVGGLVAALRFVLHLLARGLHATARRLARVVAPSGVLVWPARLVRLGVAGWLVVIGYAYDAEMASRVATLAPFGPQSAGSKGTTLALVGALGIVFLPELVALWRPGRLRRPERFTPAGSSVMEFVTNANQSLVSWALSHRIAASLVALLCLTSVGLPLSSMKIAAFTQDNQTDSVRYWVDFTADYTLGEASREIALHENFLETKKEELGFDHVSSRFGSNGGSVSIYWDAPLKPSQLDAIQKTLREEVPQPAGHSVSFADSEAANELSRDIAFFVLRGPDSEQLEEYGRQALEILGKVDGLGVVKSESLSTERAIEVNIDRDQALARGVSSQSALMSIGWALRGSSLPRYYEEGREVPFIMEFDSEEVAGLSTLRDLTVFSDEGEVALASISDVSFERTSRRIYRDDGRTTFEITAEVDDPTRLTELTERGYAALSSLDLPRGYGLGSDGSTASRAEDEAGEMQRALALSVVLVFLLMGILFESVARPFSVLVTIPFSFLGAMWMVFLVGKPMDIMGWVGLIILAGVVVNNGIVLIDCIHRRREEIGDRTRAVIEGSAQRVRPILMTAATTVFGLVPMMIEEPPKNAIDYRTLATIVAGGLIASTFFTLWVVPLAYTLVDDLAAATSRALTRGIREPVRRLFAV